jgi:uncharacterized repeat protein (TIGR01451 family)
MTLQLTHRVTFTNLDVLCATPRLSTVLPFGAHPVKSHRSTFRAAFVAGAFALLGCAAWAQPNVQSELIAEKLVRAPSGQLSTTAADRVKPGDLVAYTATYRNTGKDAARALVVTVPVPTGMEYQGRQTEEKLAPAQASLDGRSYAEIPLTRKVKNAQGQEVVQPVPTGEYRFLRWNVPELAAGANVSVRLTAKVSTNP